MQTSGFVHGSWSSLKKNENNYNPKSRVDQNQTITKTFRWQYGQVDIDHLYLWDMNVNRIIFVVICFTITNCRQFACVLICSITEKWIEIAICNFFYSWWCTLEKSKLIINWINQTKVFTSVPFAFFKSTQVAFCCWTNQKKYIQK